jgi:hypothetical protein
MAETQPFAGDAPRPRHVPAAVIADHAARRDAACLQPRDGALEKRGAGRPELVRQDFDVRQPAVIVDSDMHVLPPNPARRPSAIAVNPMADLPDAPQHLDVDVEQVARVMNSPNWMPASNPAATMSMWLSSVVMSA